MAKALGLGFLVGFPIAASPGPMFFLVLRRARRLRREHHHQFSDWPAALDRSRRWTGPGRDRRPKPAHSTGGGKRDDRRHPAAAEVHLEIADLGPGHRDAQPPRDHDRDRARDLLLRPRQALAAAPTKTPMGCCTSISPRAPTSASIDPSISTSWRPRRTVDRVRRSAGCAPPKRSAAYSQPHRNNLVLRRPIESASPRGEGNLNF